MSAFRGGKMDELLRGVKDKIRRLNMNLKDAAQQIGVTGTSLQRHLEGAYVRSDSLAKYRAWLAGKQAVSKPAQRVFPELVGEIRAQNGINTHNPAVSFFCPAFNRKEPFKVVDLFSGCGGMSLGFDLFHAARDRVDPDGSWEGADNRELCDGHRSQTTFKTVLALDLEQKVVALQNRNHPASTQVQERPAQWLNIADFLKPAEMLAFILTIWHCLATMFLFGRILTDYQGFSLSELKGYLRLIDNRFLASLKETRSSESFRSEYGRVDTSVFGQTSVIGFHEALGLPETSTSQPAIGPLPWANHGEDSSAGAKPSGLNTP